MWQRTYNSTTGGWPEDDTEWDEPSQITNYYAAALDSDPNVVAWPSQQLHLFVVSANSSGLAGGACFYRNYSGDAWSDYVSLHGQLNGPVAAVASEEGKLDIIGLGIDNRVCHRSFDEASHAWTPEEDSWGVLQGSKADRFSKPPIIVSWEPKRIGIFTTAKGSAWHIFRNEDAWSDWISVDRMPAGTSTTPTSRSRGGETCETSNLTSKTPCSIQNHQLRSTQTNSCRYMSSITPR